MNLPHLSVGASREFGDFEGEETIGFRYENPILMTGNGCEPMSKFPLTIEEI